MHGSSSAATAAVAAAAIEWVKLVVAPGLGLIVQGAQRCEHSSCPSPSLSAFSLLLLMLVLVTG